MRETSLSFGFADDCYQFARQFTRAGKSLGRFIARRLVSLQSATQRSAYSRALTLASLSRFRSIATTFTLITAVKDFIRSCGTDGFMSRVAACQCSVRDVCPSSNLGSTSRCNTGVKSLRWGFECQAIEHGADESGEYPKLPLSGAQ